MTVRCLFRLHPGQLFSFLLPFRFIALSSVLFFGFLAAEASKACSSKQEVGTVESWTLISILENFGNHLANICYNKLSGHLHPCHPKNIQAVPPFDDLRRDDIPESRNKRQQFWTKVGRWNLRVVFLFRSCRFTNLNRFSSPASWFVAFDRSTDSSGCPEQMIFRPMAVNDLVGRYERP